MGGNGGAEGLAKSEDGAGVKTLCVDEELICGFGVEVDPCFAGRAFTVAVSTIFECQDVGGHVAEEFVGRDAIGDVSGVSVKCKECESCLRVGDPPSVELGSVGRRNPNIFWGQRARMPVALESARVIREENQTALEEADEGQQERVSDENVEQEHR